MPTWRGPPLVLPWLGIAIALGAVAVRASGLEPRSSIALITVLVAWGTLAVLFAWEAMLRAVNVTRITLDDDVLRVVHGPLLSAAPRELCLARDDIERFHAADGRSQHGLRVWTVAVETRDGSRQPVIAVLDRAEALALCTALTEHLGR